ncbi:MAG: DUF488 family protein, partial [candidate division Zixibacteria bacterium]|nr:DUF488 family protein [candidate division Zixibacteria bacterium]
MPLKTKSIYEPIEKSDGVRILVMTLWPRGFKKASFDRWQKSLGTPLELIRKYKADKIEWPALKKEYKKGMAGQKKLLAEIAKLAKKETVTLLCACREEAAWCSGPGKVCVWRPAGHEAQVNPTTEILQLT